MKQIAGYELVAETSLYTFNSKVTDLVKRSWIPRGKATITLTDKSTESFLYTQVMIKPE